MHSITVTHGAAGQVGGWRDCHRCGPSSASGPARRAEDILRCDDCWQQWVRTIRIGCWPRHRAAYGGQKPRYRLLQCPPPRTARPERVQSERPSNGRGSPASAVRPRGGGVWSGQLQRLSCIHCPAMLCMLCARHANARPVIVVVVIVVAHLDDQRAERGAHGE